LLDDPEISKEPGARAPVHEPLPRDGERDRQLPRRRLPDDAQTPDRRQARRRQGSQAARDRDGVLAARIPEPRHPGPDLEQPAADVDRAGVHTADRMMSAVT